MSLRPRGTSDKRKDLAAILCNYADDTTIYTCDIRLDNVISRLESDSKIIIDWFRNNYMKLNEDKCHFMIFGERTNQEVSINIGSCAVNN